MNQKVNLLPLPIGAEILGRHIVSMTLSDLEAYARANVEHHVDPLQVEIDALEAEVRRLTRANGDLMQLFEGSVAKLGKAEAPSQATGGAAMVRRQR